MNRDKHQSDSFDLLRVRVEGAIARPGVISVTSGKQGDRQSVAAYGLATALANAGYQTLLIDTSHVDRTPSIVPKRSLTLEELAAVSPVEGKAAGLHMISFVNHDVQQVTGLSALRSVFDDLRKRFDYIVIETECALASSFALNVVGIADAVLVSVKKGRRLSGSDTKLAATLNSSGGRFLGIVAVDKSISEERVSTYTQAVTLDDHRRVKSPLDAERPPVRGVTGS